MTSHIVALFGCPLSTQLRHLSMRVNSVLSCHSLQPGSRAEQLPSQLKARSGLACGWSVDGSCSVVPGTAMAAGSMTPMSSRLRLCRSAHSLRAAADVRKL